MSLFQYYKDNAGEWRWRLRANNNEIIASGEGYKNKQDCLHAVDLIRNLSPLAEIRIYTTKDEYYVHSQEVESVEIPPVEIIEKQPEVIATSPREPETKKSRRALWAIPILLLLVLLIFSFLAQRRKRGLKPW